MTLGRNVCLNFTKMVHTMTPLSSHSNSDYPLLSIRDPEGKEFSVGLKKFLNGSAKNTRVTLGRDADNDITLSDSHKMVSRYHCYLEYIDGRWWLNEPKEGSANGTFLKPAYANTEIDIRIEDNIPIRNGDEILIPGKMTEADEPIFWRLTFRDEDETFRIKKLQASNDIEYSMAQQRLFWVSKREREEIRLSPHERSFIRYMAMRNQENNNQPVICNYEGLIEAIWGDPFGHSPNEVTWLGWSIRRKIEADSGEPRFLKTVKGVGYLLDIKLIQ
jgi:DNA-binding winged helix-turn-helix (wHTH) protein